MEGAERLRSRAYLYVVHMRPDVAYFNIPAVTVLPDPESKIAHSKHVGVFAILTRPVAASYFNAINMLAKCQFRSGANTRVLPCDRSCAAGCAYTPGQVGMRSTELLIEDQLDDDRAGISRGHQLDYTMVRDQTDHTIATDGLNTTTATGRFDASM